MKLLMESNIEKRLVTYIQLLSSYCYFEKEHRVECSEGNSTLKVHPVSCVTIIIFPKRKLRFRKVQPCMSL